MPHVVNITIPQRAYFITDNRQARRKFFYGSL
jgi:hypothetical protein